MADLQKGIDRLPAAVQAAGINARFAPVSDRDLQSVASALPFSRDLSIWYETAAPLNVELYLFTDVMWLTLYDPRDLVALQDGYRWRSGPASGIFNRWDPNWLVIGDWSADPVIAHIDQPGTPVSMAMHGAGAWDLKLIAQDLDAYLSGLAMCIEITEVENPGSYLVDVDGDEEFRPELREELTRRLRDILDEQCLAYWPWVYYQ